jgi:hypothetical protein
MSKFSSLSDMKKRAEAAGSESDDADKKRQEFYTGGVDSQSGGGSGMAVLGPPGAGGPGGGRGDARDMLDGLVSAAQRGGDESRGERDTSTSTGGGTPQRLTLWANGFVLNDGELRPYSEPANAQFVSLLMAGKVPPELVSSMRPDGALDIQMDDKRGEQYEAPPPPAYVAFGGEALSIRSASAQTTSSGAVFEPSDIPSAAPDVDSGTPSTTLQVRLLSGKKIRVKLNHIHTVLDLAAAIRAQGGGDAPFRLQAGFPPKDLENRDQTIKEADLVGAALNQAAP